MFRYLKRKHVSGEEVSDEELQIPQPNTSKGKVSDVKKIAFTVTVIWPLALNGLEKKTVHFAHCLWEKARQHSYGPSKVKVTLHY